MGNPPNVFVGLFTGKTKGLNSLWWGL